MSKGTLPKYGPGSITVLVTNMQDEPCWQGTLAEYLRAQRMATYRLNERNDQNE